MNIVRHLIASPIRASTIVPTSAAWSVATSEPSPWVEQKSQQTPQVLHDVPTSWRSGGRADGRGLADALGVHRNTIGNYLSGRTQADKRTLIAWALATGVPYVWLTDGKTPADGQGPDDGGGGVRREGIEPPTR